MKHIYVASHGHFARGLVNSLSLLIGDEHGVIPVCAYDEDIVTTEQLEQTLEHLIVQANGDEVVIFTDLLGGSINNSAVSVLMRHRNVFVVAGINLTLLLEFLLCEEATTEAAIIYATSAARESIVFINPLITQPSSDPQENLMIKLVRIDYRLLHGQVVLPGPERWISTISSSPTPKPRRMPSLRCRLTWQSQRASRWTSPPLNRRRKSLTAASWIIKSHGGPGQYCGNPRASGKSPGN